MRSMEYQRRLMPSFGGASGAIVYGGGGGQQQQYQTQKSESGPPQFIQPYLQKGIQDLTNYYNANPTAPGYYSGETVAPLSTQSQGAVGAATGLASNNPVTGAATGSLDKFLNGSYTNPLTNPDFNSALVASHQPYIDQFSTQILPGVQSSFEGAGRDGSGANQNAQEQALKTLDTTINNSDAQAGSNYYTNALGMELGANGLVPGLNSSLWQNISGLGAAGQTVDQQRQAQDAAAQAAYNYNSNKQPNYISQYLAMLNGGYPGGETNSNGVATTYQPTNSFGGMFGGALGLAGLGLQAYSAFSDARLKEDIEPVGKTFDGQNLYFYRYKGDPTPHVGLMAQEVAETKPEAVEVHPSGYLKVNYGKALGLF